MSIIVIQMRRNFIKSTTLHSAGYNPEDEILELKFTSGEIYQYFKVPILHYTGLMKAGSHGEYFNRYIKDQYFFKKLTE